MFRTLAQVSVRRCLHTSAVRRVTRPGRLGYALGASAAVTAYLVWNGQSIALDSPGPSSKHAAPLTPKGSVSPEAITSSHSTALEHEPSIYDHQETSHTPSESEDTPAAQPDPTEATVESESGGGGAFNPVTGEINWDCPCLGGMAHGPCGMQFREAFSCFVFSEKEPKGIDCVERFKAMQSCFREHPDVYGDDIMDDDDDDDVSPASVDTTSGPDETQSTQLQPEPSISVSTPSAAEETTAA